MKVGFLQTSPVFGDIRGNVDAAVSMLESLDAEISVLPELFSTGYQFRSGREAYSLAEEVPSGYAVTRLREVAREKGMHIIAGICEKKGRKAFNSAVLVGPKGIAGVYRKAHLFWREKKVFSPGDTPFSVFNVKGARIGIMICFDWIFPEAARTLALKGADIICQPSNLVLPYCPAAMVTRSIENRVFTITANRVGSEQREKGRPLDFIGLSQITSPEGAVLTRAGGDTVESRSIEIEPRRARDKFITPLNNIMKDRRAGLYAPGCK
ncbi:MAG: nitrilase-related carbon-nitrogen hydrolase [Deltaproteobacteria bacterium]